MANSTRRTQHETWLKELTSLPTAAGREQRVIQWVERWVNARNKLTLARDPAGNLIITQRSLKTRSGARRSSSRAHDVKPIWFTAHLDHPAFVVLPGDTRQREIELEFRGGVHDPYFLGAAIEIIDRKDHAHRAVIIEVDASAKPFKRVVARLSKRTRVIEPGDIGRWIMASGQRAVIRKGLLHAPACDDLAAVAAALAAMDVILHDCPELAQHVGVLLTRAEEIGFVGAIAACKHKAIPRGARLICLENSRSFAESPVGAGPIVRVGDKASVFTPELTNRISAIAAAHQARYNHFTFQRKLMPGGTCEATAFAAYGYASTCLCLPLGNYHNMVAIDEVLAGATPARCDAEFIAVSDYHGLIELLTVTAANLDTPEASPLKPRMEKLFAEHGKLLA